MGMSADELMAMRDEGEDRRVQDAFQEANCRTFVWRCRAKMDNYQDTQRFVSFSFILLYSFHHRVWLAVDAMLTLFVQFRVRYQVMSTAPLNFSNESAKLSEMINAYG